MRDLHLPLPAFFVWAFVFGALLVAFFLELIQPIIIAGLMVLSFVALVTTAAIYTWFENQRL
jgi:hypothetical protein